MDKDSYLSSHCEAKTSLIHGIGIFAKEDISLGEIVVVLGGKILSAYDALLLPEEVFFNLVQIADTLYLGANTATCYGINHSCSPNIGVQGQCVFVARRVIQQGEELCFDYETTDIADGNWSFSCHCGSPECRGYIDGNAWKDQAFRQKHAGFFSWYLQQKIIADEGK